MYLKYLLVISLLKSCRTVCQVRMIFLALYLSQNEGRFDGKDGSPYYYFCFYHYYCYYYYNSSSTAEATT